MKPEILKIREKGQLTVPAHLRKALGIQEGDYVSCLIEGDRLILRKVTAYPQASFADGIWSMIGTVHDKEDRNDVSANKHRYLGEKP